ncbi:LytR/AlgR family response regulator transcription factor [Sediminicola luteus]|uniref:DNA-binding response regulator n=1 Tax=Sediminicola luteus TaxID=319238 RepID=A0A2A4G0W4_9FLAO|nr:LytTR family DNA-binding domain-containing protein [Sediminicola luteus]PCE62629.1 DNA-binding response regulator [Sediminicola luteus]
MIRCIVIEDQPPAQRILETYISDTPNLNRVGTFHDPLEALGFLKTEVIDLIFLDIHLPKISGLDFLTILPYKPAIILTTAFPDYALESYELDVVDYLLKPFPFQRYLKAVSKASQLLENSKSQAPSEAPSVKTDSFLLRSGHDLIRIDLGQLVYIKAGSDYCELHTIEKKYLSQEPLKTWNVKLDAKGFCQCHKSYLVGLVHIRKISGNQLYLNDGTLLPIGRAYKDKLLKGFIK